MNKNFPDLLNWPNLLNTAKDKDVDVIFAEDMMDSY